MVIGVVGVATVTQQFDVAPQGNTVFALDELPLGSDTFTAKAYSVPCSQSAAATATYVSNPAVATVTADVPVSVTLNMSSGADGTVRVEFPAGTLAPIGVACIIAQALGTTTVAYPFDVAPESETVFALQGLPLGSDTFSAQAFPVPCASAAAATANWASSAVTTTVDAGLPASVTLTMAPVLPGGETVRVEFPPIVTQFSLPTANATPTGMSAGPDGNLWFTEQNPSGNNIGRITPDGIITEFPIPTASSYPESITAGPDGNLWFTEENRGKIGRITPLGTITEFVIPGTTYGVNPYGIGTGPDGNLWFTGTGVNTGLAYVGRITPQATFTLFVLPTVSARPESIAAGPDGNLWFTEYAPNKIGTISPTTGTITEYSGQGINGPISITAGPDGNLWFGELNSVGTITTGGLVLYQYPDCTACQVEGIVTGPDGNLWFTDFGAGDGDIGMLTTNDTGTKFPLSSSTGALGPYGIAVSSDGNLWFTEYDANAIGRISLPPVVAPAGVACVVVQVFPSVGNSSTYSFDVSPGSSTVFTLSGLPPGTAFIAANAYAVPCAQTAGATATYAGGISTTIPAGPASVSLQLVAQ